MIAILAVLILSCLSSCAYRAGGMDKQTPYFIPVWMRQSWVRDWLCPMFSVGLFFPASTMFNTFDLLWWLCAYGAMGGMLSTYWDKLFGYDNMWFAGFMVGMAAMFLVLLGAPWWIVLVRALVIAVVWGGLNLYCNTHPVPHSDFLEEHVRGFILG